MSVQSHIPLVSVVVLNWNGWRDTLECLEALERLEYRDHDIIVVDNNSSDHSIAKIREAFPKVTVLASCANLGFAGGNNLGMRHALEKGADYVWLLNNDTVVEPDALTRLVQRMRERPDAGMCGSTLIDYHDRNSVQALAGATYNWWLGTAAHFGKGRHAGALPFPAEVEPRLSYIIAASMLVSRSLLEEVGLMNESYFLYYEEIDWATRARGRFGLAYAPKSLVYHKQGASIGTSKGHMPADKRFRSEYFMVRSRLMFTRRYFPMALPTVYLGVALTVLVRLIRGQPGRALTLMSVLWSLLTGLDLRRASQPHL